MNDNQQPEFASLSPEAMRRDHPEWFKTPRNYEPPPSRRDILEETGTDYDMPPLQGDESQAQAHDARVQALTDSTPHPFTVSCACRVGSRRGDLREGAEVTLADVAGNRAALARLVELGVVIRVADDEAAARRAGIGARYVVSPRGALVVNGRGVLPSGAPIAATDLARAARPPVAARAAHVSREGFPVPEREGDPGDPGTDGKKELAYLVTRGRVIDTKAR